MSHGDIRFRRLSHFLALAVNMVFAALLLIPLTASETVFGTEGYSSRESLIEGMSFLR